MLHPLAAQEQLPAAVRDKAVGGMLHRPNPRHCLDIRNVGSVLPCLWSDRRCHPFEALCPLHGPLGNDVVVVVDVASISFHSISTSVIIVYHVM